MKTALITRIDGQSGTLLAQFLLKKGYSVHGIRINGFLPGTQPVNHFYENTRLPGTGINMHYGDLTDSKSLTEIIQQVQPDEIYSLSDIGNVPECSEEVEYAVIADGICLLKILEGVSVSGLTKKTKICHSSTSELYDLIPAASEGKEVISYPRNPYLVAVLYAYWITLNHRETYSMFACNGILFGDLPTGNFIIRKIARAVARIVVGLQNTLYIENLNHKHDWGHIKDFIEAMWLILQQEKPGDWVLSVGMATTTREFVRIAFETVGIKVAFRGVENDEEGYVVKCTDSKYQIEEGKVVVRVDSTYSYRSATDLLIDDDAATKAKEKLGWQPEYNLSGLIKELVDSDITLFTKEKKWWNLMLSRLQGKAT